MLNPLLLWFLPLALVPVLLHLITLRRLKTVELSTFRFLMDSYVQQRRKMRLIEWLVLLLRFLFILLIIFTLSRPVVRHFNFLSPGGSGRDVSIIIDTSPTMAIRTGGTSSLERAVDASQKLVDMLGAQDHLRLIRAGRQPTVLAEGFAGDHERFKAHLEKLAPSAATADLATALAQVKQTRPHGARLIYVLCDAMRPAWKSLGRQHVLDGIEGNARVVVMNVGPLGPVTNLAVVGDPPQALRAVKGLPVTLRATVANSSAKDANTVLSVMLNDELVRQVNVSVPAGQRISRAISVTPTRSGLIHGRFELPADAFTKDDRYLFCLNVQEKIHVLLVTGPPGAGARHRDAHPGLYVRTALEAPLHAEQAIVSTAKDRQLAAAMDVTTAAFNKVGQSMLDAADVVLLADVPLDAKLGRMLRDYAEAGGGLLILPGENVTAKMYNAQLLAASDSPHAGMKLSDPVGNPDDESGFLPIGGERLTHPILAAFAGDKDEQYFDTVRIYRHFPIQRADAKAQAPDSKEDAKAAPVAVLDDAPAAPRPVTLLRLPDRSPLLVESRLGEGHVLLSAVPASANWSNLPLKPAFVPLMLRAAAYLQRPPVVMTPGDVRPGDPAPLRLALAWSDAQAQVVDPQGKSHPVSLHRGPDAMIGAVMDTGAKGYYTFDVQPRAKGAPARLRVGFAVNLDEGAATFAREAPKQIEQLLAPAKVTYLQGSASDPLLIDQLTQKHEIWRTLIWLTFLIIAAEFVMSTLRPRGPASADGGRELLGGKRGWLGSILDTLRDTLSPVKSRG